MTADALQCARERILAPSGLDESRLEQALEATLADVRAAVADWPKMQAAMVPRDSSTAASAVHPKAWVRLAAFPKVSVK